MRVNLMHKANTQVGSKEVLGLSGGERRRLSVARVRHYIGLHPLKLMRCVYQALLSNPAIIFLDEPTSGLDSNTAYGLMKMLQDLRRVGRTIVCSIHQPSKKVYDLADRCIFMADGQIIDKPAVSVPWGGNEADAVCTSVPPSMFRN